MMGNTALITGASSGIGEELARLHARRGSDLVLVARREEALNALKQELEKAHGISATVVVADLAAPGAAQQVFAATEEAGLQIDVLINNAGFGGHGKFHERDLASDQAIAEELSGTGVTCTALCPGAVDTGFVAAGDLDGAALFQKPGASAAAVAQCGYEAMLKADLVKINEPGLSFALNWVIPLLPRKLVLKLSRKAMEKSA